MKTTLRFKIPQLLLSSAFAVATMQPLMAQLSYIYSFGSGSFTSDPAGGPELQPIGTITPMTVTIPATSCPDQPTVELSHFDENSGLAAKAFFTSTYSIEVIFQFDDVNGYNRIIDFSNGLSDNGIYVLNGCLNFYPNGNIGTCPDAFDTENYKQLAITRDGATQIMNVYLNGELFNTYVDDANHYVIDAAPNDSIRFFHDDLVIGNEASSGNVAFIRMADYAFSEAEVAASFDNFCLNITTGLEDLPMARQLMVYPNPVTDVLNIELPADHQGSTIELFNANGALVGSWVNTAIQGRGFLSVHVLPEGVYTLRSTTEGMAPMTARIVKMD